MSEAKGDSRVTEVQEWLNETYGAQSWFTKLTVDGMTGAGTCKALCKALQYEIGVKNVDGVIGAGTLAVCPTIGATVTNTNLIKIIQCGFYCKGYECGGITGHYGAAVEIAAQKFKMDAGFDAGNGELQPIFIRALLNTDAFVLVKNGKDYVREAQQYLNNTYIVKLSNWALIPCNGIPDRNMMKAIIAGLQYEEANHSTSGVDGIYGKNTLSKAPTLSSGTAKTAYVKIVQMCLMCMMETNAGMDGAFGSALKKQIEEFQKFYCLSGVTSGTVDRITWASLLSSKGETSRAAKACDTPVEYSNGYEFEYKIHKSDEQDPETDKVYDFEEIRAKIEAQDPVTQILFFITIIIVAAKAAVELVLTVIRIIVWILGRFLA